MKVIIGFLAILTVAIAKPECRLEDLNTLWPDYTNKAFFYQCLAVGKSYRMPCSQDTWFSFQDQMCVEKNDWSPKPPHSTLQTEPPTDPPTKPSTKPPPTTPPPTDPPTIPSSKPPPTKPPPTKPPPTKPPPTKPPPTKPPPEEPTTKYDGPPTPRPTKHPLPPTPPPTAPTLASTPDPNPNPKPTKPQVPPTPGTTIKGNVKPKKPVISKPYVGPKKPVPVIKQEDTPKHPKLPKRRKIKSVPTRSNK